MWWRPGFAGRLEVEWLGGGGGAMSDSILDRHGAIADLLRRQVFFVGGAPRSGTTWLQLLLDAHPQISCRGEGHFCNSLLPQLEEAVEGYHEAVQKMRAAGVEAYPEIGQGYLDYLQAATIAMLLAETADAAPIVGEKTPNNVASLDRLGALFPAAKFLILLRDGRDCAVSAWFINLHLDAAETRETYGDFHDFVEAFAAAWADYVDRGLLFAAAHPERCLTLTYEALMTGPVPVMTLVYQFLGADTDPELVRQCVGAVTFARLTGGRKRGEEDRESLFRRGVAGAWREYFDASAHAAFERIAGPQLRRLGYPEGTPGLVS